MYFVYKFNFNVVDLTIIKYIKFIVLYIYTSIQLVDIGE